MSFDVFWNLKLGACEAADACNGAGFAVWLNLVKKADISTILGVSTRSLLGVRIGLFARAKRQCKYDGQYQEKQ